MTQPREITILLLGETGVGKSTWINGFANSIRYKSFEEAKSGNIVCPIPTSFTITDDSYQIRQITAGKSDENEVTAVGQSATQIPQAYVFTKDDLQIRLIDTPGIGDVRGVDQDNKNFERVLDYISHLDSVNAICILLKPNNARLNILFKFCIKELLTHLHKDAARNIVFCFTNSRSTFYKPGDTLPALQELLRDSTDLNIPLDYSTLYCMDNESVRFLYAIKNEAKFREEEQQLFVQSWRKSVEETDRLIKKALNSDPHPILNTICINTARQTILALRKPMADMTRTIQINIEKNKQLIERAWEMTHSGDLMKQQLIFEEIVAELVPLETPTTVCTSENCVKYTDHGGYSHAEYTTNCHVNCGRGRKKYYKVVNQIGHQSLRKCSAFKKIGLCKECGCNWKLHMKITHKTQMKLKTSDIFAKFNSSSDDNKLEELQICIKEMENKIKELRQEQKQITNAAAEFSKFLKVNAMTNYNDALEDYIKHFINEAERKPDNQNIVTGLYEMLGDYKDKNETLKSAYRNTPIGPPLSPEELMELVQQLYLMKNNGSLLKSAMEAIKNGSASTFSEKRMDKNAEFVVTSLERKKGSLKQGMMSGLSENFKTILNKGSDGSEKSILPRNVSPAYSFVTSKTPSTQKKLPNPPVFFKESRTFVDKQSKPSFGISAPNSGIFSSTPNPPLNSEPKYKPPVAKVAPSRPPQTYKSLHTVRNAPPPKPKSVYTFPTKNTPDLPEVREDRASLMDQIRNPPMKLKSVKPPKPPKPTKPNTVDLESVLKWAIFDRRKNISGSDDEFI